MSTVYDFVKVKCPFFHCSDKHKISCEGITEECITTLDFKAKEAKKKHRSVFCDSKYENCEIYVMLEKKYEE